MPKKSTLTPEERKQRKREYAYAHFERTKKVNKEPQPEKVPTLYYIVSDGMCIGPFKTLTLLENFKKKINWCKRKVIDIKVLLSNSVVKDHWEGLNIEDKVETFDGQKK